MRRTELSHPDFHWTQRTIFDVLTAHRCMMTSGSELDLWINSTQFRPYNRPASSPFFSSIRAGKE
ncbi:MAG: hypothetical protein JXR73_16200 [Candidatus Omnitrophica bacterium]|nr:hypothetical protein [Candidatus Omnitrophota bacterium]